MPSLQNMVNGCKWSAFQGKFHATFKGTILMILNSYAYPNESRLRILVGMWEKGEAIVAAFTPLKAAPSYRDSHRPAEPWSQEKTAYDLGISLKGGEILILG